MIVRLFYRSAVQVLKSYIGYALAAANQSHCSVLWSKKLQEMYPKTVNLSLIVLAIFPTTFSANCDNIILLEELRNIIKSQTSQNELQTQVIKDQQRANRDLRKVVEDQRKLIQNQTDMLHNLQKKMDHMKTGNISSLQLKFLRTILNIYSM